MGLPVCFQDRHSRQAKTEEKEINININVMWNANEDIKIRHVDILL